MSANAQYPVPVQLRHSKEEVTKFYQGVLKEWALPSVWAMKARRLKGSPMIFYASEGVDPRFHRPWLVAPLDDTHPTIVVQKARQMGVTEIMITKGFHIGSLIRSRTIYTLPKHEKAREIAATRIHPLGVPNHPDGFQDWMLDRVRKGWGATMFKAITPQTGGGQSEFLITGSWNEDLGESTAADQVFLDEFDHTVPLYGDV